MSQPVSPRRRRAQSGLEAIEFGLFFIFVLPPFLWMFIGGMNFIRFIKATDVARSTALMYIKNLDFTQVGTQNIIAKVASGMSLTVNTGTTQTANGNTSGNGLIIISLVQYVGPTSCTGCANINNYVLRNRIYVGNKTLQINGTTVVSLMGNPNSALWNTTTGLMSSYLVDTRAQVPAAFGNLFSSTIGDGQLVYVVECFFSPPGGFGNSSFQGNGVYTRVLM